MPVAVRVASLLGVVRQSVADIRFTSQSGHARVASRSPAQKLYILHKKLSLSGTLCAKPMRGENECRRPGD